MIYEIDYELYSILCHDYQENMTDFKDKEYLLNCFIVYEKTNNKYICVNNIIYHWKTIEFDTFAECIDYFVKLNVNNDDGSYYKLIESFIKTQNDFINRYDCSKTLKLNIRRNAY